MNQPFRPYNTIWKQMGRKVQICHPSHGGCGKPIEGGQQTRIRDISSQPIYGVKAGQGRAPRHTVVIAVHYHCYEMALDAAIQQHEIELEVRRKNEALAEINSEAIGGIVRSTQAHGMGGPIGANADHNSSFCYSCKQEEMDGPIGVKGSDEVTFSWWMDQIGEAN